MALLAVAFTEGLLTGRHGEARAFGRIATCCLCLLACLGPDEGALQELDRSQGQLVL